MSKSSNNNGNAEKNRASSRALPAAIPKTQDSPSGGALLAANPQCGSSLKRGGTCRQPAMANGRCKMHGGKLGGEIMARPGNKNAVSHGAFLPEIQDEREQQAFDLFLSDLYESFPDLNRAGDLRHAQLAAITYVRLLRALWGEAASSTIDDLSRVFTRHLAAMRVNRDQRGVDGEGKSGPMSPAEYEVEIIQQVRMYAKNGTSPISVDPNLLGFDPAAVEVS
ncbi:MAG: hypothetical protein OEM52_02885 [bacterium]|nr:hypothetical protein [bacterium]